MARQKHKWVQARVCILLLVPLYSIGQTNLVLNPSFEEYSGSYGDFWNQCTSSTVNYWDSPTYGTPDWFDTVVHSGDRGVPSNYVGYQYPRTGNAYGGFGFGGGGGCPLCDYYEYVEGQLTIGLSGNKKYCVTYYVSLADSAWYASSTLGAYLSAFSVCIPTNYDTLPYIPQIENPINEPITNKINWVPVSGEFTATGGEQYITIGGFDSISHFTYIGGGGIIFPKGFPNTYYYIDDVSVRELTFARAGRDTSLCAGQQALLGEDSTTPGVSYYWQLYLMQGLEYKYKSYLIIILLGRSASFI